jgi:acyl-CoA thioesterase FadM
MNLWFRLLWWLLTWPRRGRLGPLDKSSLSFTVLPTDLDVNLHMNNGRFLALMDLGRLDLLARSGLVGVALKKKWRPIAAAITIHYRKPLQPFQRFQLETRILGWDEKWFYIEQVFLRGSTPLAQAWFKGLLLGPNGRIHSAEVLAAAGFPLTSPEISEELQTVLDGLRESPTISRKVGLLSSSS